jgi:hypothetical protein
MKTILYAVILAAISIVSNNNNFVLCQDVEVEEENCTSFSDFACNNEKFTSLCELINYVDLPDDFAFKTGFAPTVSLINIFDFFPVVFMPANLFFVVFMPANPILR